MGTSASYGGDIFTLFRDEFPGSLKQVRLNLKQSQKEGNKNKVGWALLHMGVALRDKIQDGSILRLFEQARIHFEEMNNKQGLAAVYFELSLIHKEMERNAIALEYAHQARTLFEELGQSLEMAWAFDNLAAIHFKMFHRQEIFVYAERARSLFLEFNSKIGLAWNSCTLAGLYADSGNYSKAERFYAEAFQAFKILRNTKGKAFSLLGLGMVLRDQYRLPEALKVLARAKTMYKKLGLKDKIAWCLLNEGCIKRMMGKEKEAVQANQQALHLFSPTRNNAGVAWGLFQIGQVHRDRGQYVKSWQALRESLNLHTDVAHKKGMGWAQNEWGKTYFELNDQSHAKDCFLKAKDVADRWNEPPLKVEVDKNLGRMNMEEGLLLRASGLLEKAQAQAKQLIIGETKIEINLEQARLSILLGDLSKAAAIIRETESMQERRDALRFKPIILIFKGETLALQGQWDEALDVFKKAYQVAGKMEHRRVRAEALMGIIQIEILKKKGRRLQRAFDELEKEVRALSSRKLKAKYLHLKALYHWKTGKSVDTRLFNQCIQILNNSKLLVLQRLTLLHLSDLYRQVDKQKERRDVVDHIQHLLREGPVDLHLIRPRYEFRADLPLSLVA